MKIGIFSGVFDPVHNGHVGFALEAAQAAQLDKVYFLVEAKPRRKTGVTHLAHRIAMVRLAVSGHKNLELLDLPDKQFSVVKTMPRLKQKFPDDQLFYLAGSDMLEHMPDWPYIDQMLSQMGLVIGLRGHTENKVVVSQINKLPVQSTKTVIIKSPEPHLASGTIRLNRKSKDLPPGVEGYIKANWLYTAPSSSSSSS